MTPELQAIVERLKQVEKQNRRARRFCFLLMLAPVLLIIACVSRTGSVVEAQRFVLRDSNGKVRVEITMDHNNPAITLFDENGKERTVIGAGVLQVVGEKGARLTLLDEQLQFSNERGAIARLDSESGSGHLWLFGKDLSQSILLDSYAPVVELIDSNGFQADLGSNILETPATGKWNTVDVTTAATLVLSGKDRRIIWRSPGSGTGAPARRGE